MLCNDLAEFQFLYGAGYSRLTVIWTKAMKWRLIDTGGFISRCLYKDICAIYSMFNAQP